MTDFQVLLDNAMCFLWLCTYTLVLIGTVKYRYPLMPLATQVCILPFETAVLIQSIRDGYGLSYVNVAYTYWVAIEIAIAAVNTYLIYFSDTKGQKRSRRELALYLIVFSAVSVPIFYFVIYKRQNLFFSYFNTFIGEVFWLYHVLQKRYPVKSLCFIGFLTKLCADLLVVPVYFGRGSWFIDCMCIGLPLLELVFICVYLEKKSRIRYRQKV